MVGHRFSRFDQSVNFFGMAKSSEALRNGATSIMLSILTTSLPISAFNPLAFPEFVMARTATKFNCASNKLSRLLWTRSFSSRIESHTKVVMAAGSTTYRQNLIVVGGGAAGFMAAIEAARGSKEAGVALDVTILEASARVLQKVKISGGGRCNVLHDEQKGIKTISEGSAPVSRNLSAPHILHNSFLRVTFAFWQRYPRGQKALLGAFSRFGPTQTADWFRSEVRTLPQLPRDCSAQ